MDQDTKEIKEAVISLTLNVQSVKEHQDEHQKMIEASFKRVFTKLDQVNDFMHGNGVPGAKTRIALLEKSSENRAKREYILFGSIIGIFTKFFIDTFK